MFCSPLGFLLTSMKSFQAFRLLAACLCGAVSLNAYSDLYKEEHFSPGKDLNYSNGHVGVGAGSVNNLGYNPYLATLLH